ncbi:TetR family transcriptional regulator [Streptomyces sp. NPDC001941]|uniref:acyl-CoA-like ligand-binding transcription factor n=1 Tax=Streptomyces sp. NPDC001941 TaxID=3154659 RepID=UPI00332B6829
MAPPTPPPPPGLRERKKLKTRAAIRGAAHRLIAAQGWEATTVEQIAREADVSPSTVFRYFPAKEDIVLADEYATLIADALRLRPADEPPLQSLRVVVLAAVRAVLAAEEAEVAQRARLMTEVPSVRARVAEATARASRVLAAALAERAGRAPDDLEARVFAAAVLGALTETALCWAEDGRRQDLPALLTRALDRLGAGLPL